MSETLDMSMMEDIVIPDTADVQEPDTTSVEPISNDPTQTATPDQGVVDPVEDVIDTSLTGIEPDPIDGDEPTGSGALYATLAETLKEEGFFNSRESIADIDSLDALALAFKDELKSNEYSDLNDAQKRVLEGFREGIPTEDIIQHETRVNQYSSITDEVLNGNDELQKALFMTDMQAKGITESRAEKLYEISYDSGELLQEAKLSLATLQEKEALQFQAKMSEQRTRKEDEVKAVARRKETIKKSIYDVDKFLGDVEVTDRLKDNVHSSMTDIVGYDDKGQPMNALMKAKSEDPLNFEKNLYYLFELTNGFTDVKKFAKQADSKAAKKLENLIANNTLIRDNSSGGYQSDPESFDPGSIVSLI